MTDLKFNSHFLNCILFGCITDTAFLRKIRQQFPVEAFRSPIRIELGRLLYDYIDTYHQAPDEMFFDLFHDFIETKRDSKRQLYYGLVDHLNDIETINPEYLLDKVAAAVRHIRIEAAVINAAKLVKREQYDDAEATLWKAFKDPSIQSLDTLEYFKSREGLLRRVSEDQFLMRTMIPSIDHLLGGIRRRETVIWMGTPKAGKTYGLINMAHAALMQGLNVVFVSLELDKYRIEARMDQATGFLSSVEGPVEVMQKVGTTWVKRTKTMPSIHNIELVEKNREMLKRYGGKLIIAYAPNSTKNFMDIDRYLDELEITQSFIPDVVLVDYLRNMKGTAASQNRKERVSENCQGLVKMAAERNCIVHAAQQGNRKAMTAKVLTPDMIADDIDTIGFVDTVFAICQTRAEEAENKARIYLAMVREGPKGATVEVTRDLARGQFWLEDRIVQWAWGDE